MKKVQNISKHYLGFEISAKVHDLHQVKFYRTYVDYDKSQIIVRQTDVRILLLYVLQCHFFIFKEFPLYLQIFESESFPLS